MQVKLPTGKLTGVSPLPRIMYELIRRIGEADNQIERAMHSQSQQFHLSVVLWYIAWGRHFAIQAFEGSTMRYGPPGMVPERTESVFLTEIRNIADLTIPKVLFFQSRIHATWVEHGSSSRHCSFERSFLYDNLTELMLTGKAKSHFDVWARRYPDMNYSVNTGMLEAGNACFSKLPNCVQQAFILKWLDSVEIYVSIIPVVRAAEYFYFSEVTYRWYRQIETWSSRRFTTRESATEAAIKQAIAIYNEKG